MRLLSTTLRNYRLHRELRVDFDRSRTLIGSSNETGKSTLIEAVHRALFLKAKGNTEHHRAMKSTLHLGNPEVELSFEAGGKTYLLKKRFGLAGTATLAASNSAALSGDAAETELARILGVEAGLSGKALALQWAHLWVWQGQSGGDPSVHATAQQAGLIQRLQQMGGAALQSELDARITNRFADAVGEIYNANGKPKADSALRRAEAASELAAQELTRARARVQELDYAVADLDNATRDLRASSALLAELEKQQAETNAKVQQLALLRQQEAEQLHSVKSARERQEALASADKQILGFRLEISALEESLQPQREKVRQMEDAREELKIQSSIAEQAHRTAAEVVRNARARHDLASAHHLLFDKAERHRKLSEQDARVSQRRRDLAELEEQLAKLPKVDAAKLRLLQRLESACSVADATLQAMATGLQVMVTDQPVLVGGQSLPVGQKQILTDDTEVSIGSAIRLRIQPGGGTSLADARQKEQEARTSLRANLDALALQSVLEAAEVHARRDGLISQIKATKGELDGMGAESLAEDLHNAQAELTEARAKVERLMAVGGSMPAPDDKTAAKALVALSEAALGEAESQETEAKAGLDRLLKKLALAESTWQEKRAQIDQQGLTLNGLKAQLNFLVSSHGDDVARQQALIQLQAARIAAENLLKTTIAAIADLQPALLEADQNRIARAIEQKRAERHDASTRMAVAQAALRSDGSEDPRAALATAEASVRSATAHRTSVLRQAQAIALLDKLFQEEQHTLAERFTQPLGERIAGYLQSMFGPSVRAKIGLENNEFTGLELSRFEFGGSAFAFATLSGGAKEQLAAAVRLAMSEVLAPDHGGCLPVVFDDAFTNSDPERVNRVQRMLDLAASRGLQIIVLTCNPADYAGLGAKNVVLPPVRGATHAPNNQAADAAAELPDTTATDANDLPEPHASIIPVTDELRQKLIRVLTAQGGSMGNQTLREELGWDEVTYDAVKDDLVATGILTRGRGRGGSVSLSKQSQV